MNNNLCILPWISLETSPLGEIRPCCLSTENITDKGQVLNLNNATLTDAFNSDYMQDLRKDFIAGKKPNSCKRCWDEEASGRISKRQNSYRRLKDLINNIDFTKVESENLIFVDFKLGNICNLKCRICGSFSSSKWAQEEINIDPTNATAKLNLQNGRWPRTSEIFWDDVKRLLNDVRYVEFTGGEPFLIDEHFDLLEYAVEQGYSKNIEIHYNTNCTVVPERGLKLWPHFKKVEIAVSIDDVKDRFEYQRYGASWSEVLANLQKYKKLRDENQNIILQLCLTTNIQNFYYLDEICQWIPEQNFDFVYFNVLHDVWYFSIKHLNKQAKDLINKKFENYTGPYADEIKNLLIFMNQGQDSDCKMLNRTIKNSDKQRNQNFADHHKEIAEAIGYAKT